MPGPALDVDLNREVETPSKSTGGLAAFDKLLAGAQDAVSEAARLAENPEPEASSEPEKQVADEPKAAPEPKKKPKKPVIEEDEIPDFGDLEDLAAEPEKQDVAEEPEDEVPAEVKRQGEKAETRWKELRAAEKENKTLKAELETLRKQAQAEDQAALRQQLEAAQKRVEEQEKVLKATAVYESKEYKEKVTEPLEAMESAINGFFPADDRGKADAIIEALLKPMPQTARDEIIEEQLDGYSELSRNRMYQMVRAVENIYSMRDSLLQDSERAAEAFAAEKMAKTVKQKEQERAAFQGLSDDIWKRLTEKLPGLTDDDGNVLPEVASIHEELKGIDFRDMKDSTLVYSAYANKLLPKVTTHLAGRIKAQAAEIKDLKAAIRDLKGTEPGGGGGGDLAADEPGSNLGFLDSLERKFASGQIQF